MVDYIEFSGKMTREERAIISSGDWNKISKMFNEMYQEGRLEIDE